MFKKYFSRSPFLSFLPFLFFYIVIVIMAHSDTMFGDEGRYYHYVERMLNGHYSSPAPGIDLWSGPGYPILIFPFVALKLPLITITLLNAFLFYVSVVLLFLTLKRYISLNKSIAFSVFFACYYIAYEEMPLIYTEIFSIFLITSILYFFTKAIQSSSRKSLIAAGLLTGYLVLTKIAFGYVLLVLMVFAIAYYLFYRSSVSKKILLCLSFAFLVNAPYLLYTYSLTHKIFYWGNSGGISLYWMSTPHEGEFGDWHNEDFTADCGNEANPELLPCSTPIFQKVHGRDMEYVNQFVGVAKDDAYKKLAIANIKSHPIKFLKNCVSNVSRMFFNFPFTYTYQKDTSVARFPMGSIIFVLMLLSIIPTILNWRKLPLELRCLLLFLLFYMAASTIVSAYSRQLSVVIPVFILWFGYIFEKTTQYKVKFSPDNP